MKTSVPSSSGRSLSAARAERLHRRAEQRDSSVPSSSGRSLNRCSPSTAECRSAFSPLFIGEVPQRGRLRRPIAARVPPSVPSSSGRSLNGHGWLIPTPSNPSVPSSSGRSLNSGCHGNHGRNDLQSPLHRGGPSTAPFRNPGVTRASRGRLKKPRNPHTPTGLLSGPSRGWGMRNLLALRGLF
jgi:hypothetical protein